MQIADEVGAMRQPRGHDRDLRLPPTSKMDGFLSRLGHERGEATRAKGVNDPVEIDGAIIDEQRAKERLLGTVPTTWPIPSPLRGSCGHVRDSSMPYTPVKPGQNRRIATTSMRLSTRTLPRPQAESRSDQV